MGEKKGIGKEQETDRNDTKLTYELTYEDVVDILKVIDNSMGGELHVELGDLKLKVVKRGSSVPTFPMGQGEVAPAGACVSTDREKGIEKKA